MPITQQRIAELAAKKGVRAIAVENFLGSLGGLSERDARANLSQDAGLYRWNAASVGAIRKGITEAYAPAKAPPRAKAAPRRLAPIDREWQREQAMQAGMGLGVEAYNDAMGWGSDGD
jgi:hypothetical protein